MSTGTEVPRAIDGERLGGQAQGTKAGAHVDDRDTLGLERPVEALRELRPDAVAETVREGGPEEPDASRPTRLLILHDQRKREPECVVRVAEHLLLAMAPTRVHSALAYYYDHKDEIEGSFEEDRKGEAEHETRKVEYLSRRPSR